METFPPAARAAIHERAGGRCEWCGGQEYDRPDFGRWFEYHHRKAKSAGGTSDPAVHDPDNGALTHESCHKGGPDTIHGNPRKARRMGLNVSRLGTVRRSALLGDRG